MTIQEIRKMFPALKESVYGKPLVYFDNAATSQRPNNVIEKWTEMVQSSNANIHRAIHHLASIATYEYESTRDFVRLYLNAESRDEIIFTSGTTGSINLVAYSFGETYIHKGDEIIVTADAHHSNIVPWQLLCERKGAKLRVVPIDDEGHLCLDELVKCLNKKTKLATVTQISNVLGIENPIKSFINICHSMNCPVLVDGAQGIVHQDVNVQDLDCDFYAFSGHKVYAATGTGVLYGKKKYLEEMVPYQGGGEMISRVTWEKTTYAPLPEKFEAGTQNLNSVPTLKLALDLAQITLHSEITKNQELVSNYLLKALTSDPRIHLYGVPRGTEHKCPIFSFTVNNAHHEDLALILDKMGIAVRSGHMCAEPLMDRFGVTGMLRASIAPYNTLQEAEYFIESLNKAIEMLV